MSTMLAPATSRKSWERSLLRRHSPGGQCTGALLTLLPEAAPKRPLGGVPTMRRKHPK